MKYFDLYFPAYSQYRRRILKMTRACQCKEYLDATRKKSLYSSTRRVTVSPISNALTLYIKLTFYVDFVMLFWCWWILSPFPFVLPYLLLISENIFEFLEIFLDYSLSYSLYPKIISRSISEFLWAVVYTLSTRIHIWKYYSKSIDRFISEVT